MEKIIIENLKLVNFVLKKMNISNKSNYEDYYQVGVIGLINAAKMFNYDSKFSFSTYAYVCIKNEILNYIKKNEKNYLLLQESFYDEINIEDKIADESINIIDTIIMNETNNQLYFVLNNKLSDLERKIIKMSYGIGCREYKQVEIAKILDIQQYKVSRIKKKALEQLKKYINSIN